MIRLLLVAIFLVAFLLLSIPVFLIEWLIGKWKPHLRDISCLRIVQGAVRIISFLAGTKVTVIGEENIPKDTPALFIGNHRSYFDIVVTYSRFHGLTGFVGKKELAKIPLFSTWMRFLHCHFLDRSDVREGLKTILAAIEDIKQGISIVIFPEGTRNTNADETELLPFHEGSFKVATKTGCPIIPISINHTSEIFEDHMPFIRSTHVTIEYGTPIYPKELPREQQKFLGQYVQGIIETTLKKNA
jgi:1-acyl-sn-glycerol-3-phosphate acyltransferase